MDYETGCKSYRATLRALLIKHFTDLVLDQNGKLPPDCHPTVSNCAPAVLRRVLLRQHIAEARSITSAARSSVLPNRWPEMSSVIVGEP